MAQPVEKLHNKIIISDGQVANDSDNSGELNPQPIFNDYNTPSRAGEEGGKKLFKASTKKKMQLTFENITITTIPKKGRCGKPSLEKPKEILKNVSGTIEPG